MASSTRQTRSMTASSSTPSKPAALTAFRIGEEKHHADDASDSDSDQSAHSERKRSVSPEKIEGKRTKSKKKRERRKVGALTDGLDVLLGSAFKGEGGEGGGVNGNGSVETGAKGDVDEEMGGESTGMGVVGKKMSKRTRQNLLKMEQRRQQKLATKQREMLPEPTHQNSHPIPARKPLDAQKKATGARRARKERARLARKEGEGERMDIG
ncbi:hypothetical protein T440DRAFT_559207 [Plenodomus tracheiphilus IPT5]|uniref:Ribosome biogenesis protein SLX9 n=1 Tax=Plenodomus tracheiphilus IPT5 TaxID=1408161 RepID=A0A6A7AP77_9PLEO|nr:hypothetical protein T440DRAFT_559207 [Plenodomus tracheiphilus IPT5]